MARERWVTRLRAAALRTYPTFATAASTAARADSDTYGSLLSTRDTVPREMPASAATS